MFRNFDDGDVAKRYPYAQFCLTRLNWVLPILDPRGGANGWFYYKLHWSYSTRYTIYCSTISFDIHKYIYYNISYTHLQYKLYL